MRVRLAIHVKSFRDRLGILLQNFKQRLGSNWLIGGIFLKMLTRKIRVVLSRGGARGLGMMLRLPG